eukprot:CAMPEP_0117541222 /NCGR_PEP_ID=MMETSP0784-20121206/43907_1 /TAXON_ID=39447 /ORGANISM="" /LENGTH=123 /DNA_ID=CAMNT_0005337909 /DNA_START=594 /DNA_END=965 /DNA_ORIENTATION=-
MSSNSIEDIAQTLADRKAKANAMLTAHQQPKHGKTILRQTSGSAQQPNGSILAKHSRRTFLPTYKFSMAPPTFELLTAGLWEAEGYMEKARTKYRSVKEICLMWFPADLMAQVLRATSLSPYL